ncbi:MAG: type IV secretory system conjugative DNA transfer family protein, partial [Granulosicoccus sp.]|nr:type IV secretory system conjugative DNA transfer family protein [Granulosicoccus sp.]
MVQPFADRLWSARGALFTTFLSLLAIWICLMTVRRVLAGSFGLTLPPVDNLSQLVQRPGDAFILTRVAIAEYPWSVFRAWGAGIAASTASVALGLATLWLLLRRVQERTGHGSSKWATRQDIVKAGLLDNEHTGTSLIVGGWSDAPSGKASSVEYLVYTAPESLTAFAPSGSAKTVALVIPNLLCYESSAFVLDVKGELWEATAGYRQRELNQHVLYHDPSKNDGQGACYNPLEEIQIGHESAVSDVQMLAEYLIPRSAGNSGNAEHFETSARSLIVGVMLHELSRKALADEPAANIAGVLSEVSNPVRPFKEYLQDMLAYQAGNPLIAQVIRETASEMLQKEDREFSGVLSSMITPLTKWRDPILAAATAHSDFRIMDLVDRDQGMTLYLTIRPSERDRLKHYFGMFINL